MFNLSLELFRFACKECLIVKASCQLADFDDYLLGFFH